MDKLTRVDFMVNVNAIGSNSEILNKALNKLNELQENKKAEDDSYSDYYYAYIFDARNEIKTYVFSNVTVAKYGFTSNFVGAEDINKPSGGGTVTNPIPSITSKVSPDYGFEYLTGTPTSTLDLKPEDSKLISSKDSNFKQAELSFISSSYGNTEDYTVTISGIPQKLVSVQPFQEVILPEPINTTYIIDGDTPYREIPYGRVFEGGLTQTEFGYNKIMTHTNSNGLYDAVAYIFGNDEKWTTITLATDLKIDTNGFNVSNVYGGRYQVIAFFKDNGNASLDLVMKTLDMQEKAIVNEKVVMPNCSNGLISGLNLASINWDLSAGKACALITFTKNGTTGGLPEFKYLHVTLNNLNAIPSASSSRSFFGGLVGIGNYLYNIYTNEKISWIPDVPYVGVIRDGDYLWYITSSDIYFLDALNKTLVNTISKTGLAPYSEGGTGYGRKLVWGSPEGGNTVTANVLDGDTGEVKKTSIALVPSDLGTNVAINYATAKFVGAEKKYIGAKNFTYVSETKYAGNIVKFNYDQPAILWIEYSDSRSTYYDPNKVYSKTVFLNIDTMAAVGSTTTSYVVSGNASDFSSSELIPVTGVIGQHGKINDVYTTTYPALIDVDVPSRVTSSNVSSKKVVLDIETGNYLVFVPNCTGSLDGVTTSYGQTGVIIYNSVGVHMATGLIVGSQKDSLKSVKYINNKIYGFVSMTEYELGIEGATVDKIFAYNPNFQPIGERIDKFKYSYVPQIMDTNRFSYDVTNSGGTAITDIEIKVWK